MLRRSLIALLAVAGCGDDLPSASALIDGSGGDIAVAGNAIALEIPPGALPGATEVTLSLRSRFNEKGDYRVASRIVDIELDPALDEPLAVPAVLRFFDVDSDGGELRIARSVDYPGTITSGALPARDYWMPQENSVDDGARNVSVQLVGFSSFAVVETLNQTSTSPNSTLRAQPERPADTEYVGFHFLNNNIVVAGASTAPVARRAFASDALSVRYQEYGSGDMRAIHIFEPVGFDGDCPIAREEIFPPMAPPGTRYIGRSIFVNDTWEPQRSDAALASLRPQDDQHIVAQTLRNEQEQRACDYTTVFTFTSADPTKEQVGGSGEFVSLTGPGSSTLELPSPLLADPVDVDIEIDSLPLGETSPSFFDLYRLRFSPGLSVPPPVAPVIHVAESGMVLAQPWIPGWNAAAVEVEEGDGIDLEALWRGIPRAGRASGNSTSAYLADPEATIAVVPENPSCVPDNADLQASPPPVGFTYIGALAIVNGAVVESRTTLDTSLPTSASDLVRVRARTAERSGELCEIVVAHVYKPSADTATCTAPEETLNEPAPPQTGYCYVGHDVVINGVLDLTTVPENRGALSSDLNVLETASETGDGYTCDVVVRHLFQLCL